VSAAQANSSALGLAYAPVMLVDPGSVFRRIAETGRYGWTLAAWVLLTTLIGWVTVQTGLIDRQVDRETRRALADLEREQIDLLSRTELSERLEKIRKSAEFTKLITRGGAIVSAPVGLVVSVMLIAALLFAVVAWAGHKAEYPTLVAVCVYSAVVDVLAAGLRLAMMLCYRTIDVDTSLGLLVPVSEQTGALKTILSAIDPFRMWFWILVGVGLVVTGQLSRRAAVTTCVVFWLVATGARIIPVPTGWLGA
jgi:hypothetical protein